MEKKKSIQYLASPLLSSFEGVGHAFLSRAGGVSPAPFDSLNLSAGNGDSGENVGRNFELLKSALGVHRGNLFAIRQVHGSDVMVAEDFAGGGQTPPEADAAITAQRGAAVGVLTADCLPVLLYDPVKRVAGAAHAGWKGTVRRVSVKTVEAMAERFGSRPGDIRAALGPCIGPCCYTVGEEVVKEFSGYPEALSNGSGQARLDIAAVNISQLVSAGLRRENITGAGACTACENGLFFSYRKDNGRTGRQLSFIMLKG